MRAIRWNSLRTKIIGWSFVPTAIILAMVALVNFIAYRQVTADLVIERDQELTRLSAGQLISSLNEYANLLTSVARTADVYGGMPEDQQAALERAHNRLVIFDGGVVILDTYGTVVAADPPRPDALGQDWSDHHYFRQMVNFPQTVYSDIVPDGPDGAEVIVVAVPVTGEQGEFLGTMAGMFRIGATAISAFYGDIVKLRIGISGSAYLVDEHGRVIYHSDADRIGEDFSSQPVVRDVLSGMSGAIRTRDLDGREIVASFAPVPGTPWSLVTQESWSALVGASLGYQRFLLVLLALGVVLPALVVAVGVRRITQPIEDLIAAAQEVASGNFGQTITPGTDDELKELTEQFNRMSAQLQASYGNLEQRVADRTRDLAMVNVIMQTVSQSLDLNAMLGATLDKVMELLDFEAGAIYLRDSRTGKLRVICQQGIAEELPEEDGVDPLSARVARTGQPVVIEDLTQDVRRDSLAGPHTLLAGECRSLLSLPLIVKGRVEGVLTLASAGVGCYDAEATDLLLPIGRQIGVAVENAQLYKQAQQVAVLEERQRLARELHDAVTQTLFSASLIAEVLPKLWERDADVGREKVEELRQLTRGALAEMRTLLLELRPAALADADLGDLLRQLAESTAGRARVPVALDIQPHRPLPPDIKIVMYRIAQEALNNVVKHANASRVTVRLKDGTGGLSLEVIDDGGGFDLAQVPPEHLGLGIMQERATGADAVLRIESQVGHGTRVMVMWSDEMLKERL